MTRSGIAATVLLLAISAGGAGIAGAAENDTCGAEALKPLLNRRFDEVEAQLPALARILPPDSVMTQDHRPERVNVNLDETGVIVRIWCG